MASKRPISRLYVKTNDQGYVFFRDRHHPLGYSNGDVPRHRAVLWEAMGKPPIHDPVPCDICGWGLPWRTTDRTLQRWKAVINVDHINRVPGDDRRENLRPLCHWCNGFRKHLENKPEWEVMIQTVRTIPPMERANGNAMWGLMQTPPMNLGEAWYALRRIADPWLPPRGLIGRHNLAVRGY